MSRLSRLLHHGKTRPIPPSRRDPFIQGEWMTPKRLQNLQTTICPSCNQAIETIHLVQPSEGKQRSKPTREIYARIDFSIARRRHPQTHPTANHRPALVSHADEQRVARFDGLRHTRVC